MKIAVVSDIHGNHYALKKVLKEAKKEGVEKLLILGDIVGYYYHPEKVMDLLSKWPCEIIKGNHERILQDVENNKISIEKIITKYGSGHSHALNKLDPTTLSFLYSLPERKSVSIDDIHFQLNHGSPWKLDHYLYPDSDYNELTKCNSHEADFVLIGHSHYSFCFKCRDSMLINVGSVGQSRQKGGMAYWAVINTENKCFEIKITPYNVENLLEEVLQYDSELHYLAEILKR